MKVECAFCHKHLDTRNENYQYYNGKFYHFDIYKPDTCWAKQLKHEHEVIHGRNVNTETF